MLQLCDLYENDCIFDKFDCAISGNGQYVTTGSYNNFLKVTGRQGGAETIVEASRDPLRKRLQPQAKVQTLCHSTAFADKLGAPHTVPFTCSNCFDQLGFGIMFFSDCAAWHLAICQPEGSCPVHCTALRSLRCDIVFAHNGQVASCTLPSIRCCYPGVKSVWAESRCQQAAVHPCSCRPRCRQH